MAITYPLSLPITRAAAGIHIVGGTVVGMGQSPFTMEQQIQVYPGQAWMADVTLPPMREDDAEPWIAFLLSLNGREGTFLMGDPARKNPRGVATGSPQVKGGSQTGSSLIIDGFTHSITNILKAGDNFHMVVGSNYRLHKILQNVDSNSSGEVTVDIFPRLRESPADNTVIVLNNSLGQFRLTTTTGADWSAAPGTIYNIAFGAQEAI